MFIGASAGIGRYFPRPVSGGGEEETTLLLDDFAPAHVALSLRKLRTDYTGSAIEVFNGTDFADIGFVSDELDTTALAAHCGSNDGFVSTWYDQSGNGNNLLQTNATERPKIYDGASASVTLENGKPIVESRATANLDLSSYVGATGARFFSVVKGGFSASMVSNGNNNFALIAKDGNASHPHKDSGAPTYRVNSALVIADTGTVDRDDMYDALLNQSILTVSLDTAGGTVDYDDLTLGYDANPAAYPMLSTQEFILFHADVSAEEAAIETNMNSFYSVHAVPTYSYLLNDYGTSEIALSLRKLDSTYAGSAVEVYNGTSMADIGFVDNELDTVALAAHCGSNDGHVATWYDQSGNGKDFIMAQEARRPRIYDGATASVLLENGKPILEGGGDNFMTLASYTGQTGVRIFNVVKGGFSSVHLSNTTDNFTAVLQNGNTGSPHKQSGTVVYRVDGSEITTANRDTLHDAMVSQNVFTVSCDTAGDGVDYDSLALGYEPNAGVFPMLHMQEMVLFHTDVSAEETAIENSINDFYSVF